MMAHFDVFICRLYRKRTNVYEGLTPLWKESLDLPFTPPMADFSPANLAQVFWFASFSRRHNVIEVISKC